ncbi:hypothetical protein J5N97_006911 [Dioscorea zingiberensis]|uniref:ZF-HD dimerization-type domain-containing protein n=1 Tax=Dioscorea zingiberensis TaxID=325984 RepID=A0A9D5DD12_9LILI|nr:hypothetical protein J5N97_006911 [Dioscorea zingiberensis]
MASSPRAPDPDASKHKKNVPTPNGATPKNHHYHRSPSAPDDAGFIYLECVRNHAANLGGHAVDGCGEFISSSSADPAVPSSLLCAACGCHRNFHRRHSLSQRSPSPSSSDAPSLPLRSPSPPPPAHMLLALRSGFGSGANPIPAPPRKRFRTKFTAEQKDMMHELAQELGWRMRRKDEGFLEKKCREIGVRRSVFKVWMHNNKHAFPALPSPLPNPMDAAGNAPEDAHDHDVANASTAAASPDHA